MRLGFLINPIAGLGGRVGLKGSDGIEIQRQALALGARPIAPQRAAQTLAALTPWQKEIELITPDGAMGAEVARQCGLQPTIIGPPITGSTTPEHTIAAAQELLTASVDLLLFAGGDGTARDIVRAVSLNLPVVGIPAGVKIYSAVFATHPYAAAEVVAAWLRSERRPTQEAEVVDLDEESYRRGTVNTRLYGYLRIPAVPQRMQNRKAPSPASEAARLQGIAVEVIESMLPDSLYIVGPGTTTRAIAERLGFPKTLVGVDVFTRTEVVALDVGEAQLLALLEGRPARIVLTPIGGQGFLFGRGNQPISPAVIRQVGRENILVVSLVEKLNALRGTPLLVDTGDPQVDQLLSGYLPIIVGYHNRIMYRVSA